MVLSPVDVLDGILNICMIVTSIMVGILIIRKYSIYKRREFLFIGIAAVLSSEPWWPHAITFILLISIAVPLSIQAHLFIGYAFIPITLICWSIAFMNLLELKNKKVYIIIIIVYSLTFEIYFLLFLFNTPELLGIYSTSRNYDLNYAPYMIVNQLIFISILIITGTIFALNSFKSDNPEVRLKGKFLLFAFFFYSFGGLIDIMSPFSFIHLMVSSFMLFCSVFLFYGGFFLPEWISRRLCKDMS
ncbi:MAG: hypothetical protein ACTSR8_11650 [Promethearchaeota archaeon]